MTLSRDPEEVRGKVLCPLRGKSYGSLEGTCWGSGPGRRNSPEVDTTSPGDNVEVISLKSFPTWKFHSICRIPIAHAYFNFPLDISSLSLSFLLDFHSFFVKQILSTSENDFWNQTPWIVFCARTYCVTLSEWLHCVLRLSLSNKIEMIKAPTSGGCWELNEDILGEYLAGVCIRATLAMLFLHGCCSKANVHPHALKNLDFYTTFPLRGLFYSLEL